MASHAVTMANFESVVESHPIVILDFWAAWCAPCRAFAPVFERLAELHPDVYFGKVDTEAERELAAAFQVRSIPTIMAFKQTELVFEQAGMLPVEAMEKLLGKLRELKIERRESVAGDAAEGDVVEGGVPPAAEEE